MKPGALRTFGAQLRALRVAAGFTQEELAKIRRPVGACGQRARARRTTTAARRHGPRPGWALDTAANERTISSLPIALTGMLGRDGDVRTLRQWLRDPSARLITLVGPGGVGKTARQWPTGPHAACAKRLSARDRVVSAPVTGRAPMRPAAMRRSIRC
jgi:hypothetical protein